MGDIGNHSVEPVLCAHVDMSKKDIVEEEHEDQKGVDKCKHSEIGLKSTEQ